MSVPDDIRVGLAEAGLFLLLVLLGEEVVEVGHGADEDGLLGRAQEVKVDDGGRQRHECVVNRTDGRDRISPTAVAARTVERRRRDM